MSDNIGMQVHIEMVFDELDRAATALKKYLTEKEEYCEKLLKETRELHEGKDVFDGYSTETLARAICLSCEEDPDSGDRWMDYEEGIPTFLAYLRGELGSTSDFLKELSRARFMALRERLNTP